MALYCLGHPSEITESQLHRPWQGLLWIEYEAFVCSLHLPQLLVYKHPSNIGQSYELLTIWSHTSCVKSLQGPEDENLFSKGNKENMFGGVWIWKTLLNTLTPATSQADGASFSGASCCPGRREGMLDISNKYPINSNLGKIFIQIG